MPEYDYDLFVIGGGSGGVRAARVVGRARQARGHRRGVALRRHLRHPRLRAEEAAGLRLAIPRAFRGRRRLWLDRAGGELRLADADRQQGPRDRPPGGRSTSTASKRPAARRSIPAPCWSTAHTIRIESENRTVTADQILIATGGRPNPHAALPGHEHCIFSNEAFDLPVLPKAIVIAGGGYIAVEFANIFHGLGVETTLIYRGREILSRFDHGSAQGPARRDGKQRHQSPLPHDLRADRQARRRPARRAARRTARC